jgi:hypothetical protein
MTKNGLDIQTISTKRTEFQTDRFLLLGQVIQKKGKTLPSHFLNFPLASHTNGTFFCQWIGKEFVFCTSCK